MLVDGNLLIYAVDEANPRHGEAHRWWTAALNGDRRVALPWPSLAAFLRITTNPRASANPLSGRQAWSYVSDWLQNDLTWIPNPTERHASVLGSLIERYDLRANWIPDAVLAALSIEHGLTVFSADTDFARFDEITWVNPVG
jgi:toxin-antitoxin system PIN domain toxin